MNVLSELEHLDQSAARLVLDSLADGVYITDTERRIIFWNAAAETMTGWPSGMIVGRTCFDDILAHEDLNGHPLCGKDTCPLHGAIAHNAASRLPVLVFAKRRDGQRIPVEVSVAPIRNGDGGVVGGVESFRDLSPLMQDLDRAHVIQQHAMQAPLPEDERVRIAHYNMPLEYVSGDFSRIESIDADRYAIMLADVTGHGVASALYAMQIRSLWEEARSLLPDPVAFAAHLNEKLYELTREDDCFATAIYGVLDAKNRRFRYVRAGHPPPILMRGGKARLCEARPGCAIGLLPEGSYQCSEQPLQAGDRLLLYSDGAIEARAPDGGELEIQGWIEMVERAEGTMSVEFLKRLELALLDYVGQVSLDDDLSLVGVLMVE